MKTIALVLTVLFVVGGALTASAQTTVVVPAPAPAKYTGEVWTWDSGRSIVTLYDAGRQFRVQVTPDQIARLNHHSIATVTGVLLGPEVIETVIVPAQPLVAQLAGPATTMELDGKIVSIDANGTALLDSSRGQMRVWLADSPASRFSAGNGVKMQVSVTPVRMVAVAGGGGLASGPTVSAPTPVPGDQAVVVGRVLSISPTGVLSVDSPRGPISVWVSDAAKFKVGDFVQVQTIVQPA